MNDCGWMSSVNNLITICLVWNTLRMYFWRKSMESEFQHQQDEIKAISSSVVNLVESIDKRLSP